MMGHVVPLRALPLGRLWNMDYSPQPALLKKKRREQNFTPVRFSGEGQCSMERGIVKVPALCLYQREGETEPPKNPLLCLHLESAQR